MDNDLQETIKKRIAELPEEVQHALLDPTLSDRIKNVGLKHQLHVDQLGTLEDEILLVMIGITEPKDFASHLEHQLHLDAPTAAAVAADISSEILVPIRVSMQEPREAHPADMTLSQKTVSMPPPTIPPPAVAAPTDIPQKPPEAPKSPIYKADPYREPPV